MNINKARALVAQRSSGLCEMCRRAEATDWHHRKNRSQGGEWTPSNGLHLCRNCHRVVTEQPYAARRWGWAVPRSSDPVLVPVRLLHLGWVYLDDQGGYQQEVPCPEP